MSHDPTKRREGQLSRDRDTIREWAREHDATPIRETKQEGESDRVRMVPKDEMSETHEEVEWEEFFDELDEGDRVVIFHADSDREPFEVVGQTSLADRVDDDEIEQRLMRGETVTSTITETTVVESVVVEEVTVDSELVDTQVSDERVVDSELLRRECTDSKLIDDETADAREWFDTDRYLETIPSHDAGEPVGSTKMDRRAGATKSEMDATDRTEMTASKEAGTRGTEAGSETAGVTKSTSESTRTSESGRGSKSESGDQEFPFGAELEVEETWAVTRSFTEEFTVESIVTDTEVTEADTIEDYDIEIEGLHRSIVEGGIIKEDIPADEAMSDYEIESELSEPDRITTTFARELTVEDEIVDKVQATAGITEIQPLEMEIVRTRQLENVAATSDTHEEMEAEEAAAFDADEEMSTHEETEAGTALDTDEETPTHSTAGEGAGSRVTLTDDSIGKPVINAKGERMGMVTKVEEEANALFIDPEPGIAERIRSVLGWGNADEDDYRLEADMISRVTDDGVELKSPEELD